MKKITALLMSLVLSAMVFSGCSFFGGGPAEGSGSDPGESSSEDTTGIMYDVEDDEVHVAPVKRDVSDYYGSWEAKSDRAQYLYGNVDITINENGTWTGDITGEKLGGSYEYKGDHMHMNDDLQDLFSFDLAFDKSGSLVLIDTDSDDEINTVLTKK